VWFIALTPRFKLESFFMLIVLSITFFLFSPPFVLRWALPMHHWHTIYVMYALQKHRYDNNLSLYTVHCSRSVLPFCTSSCIDEAKTRYFCSLSALHTLNFVGFIGDLHVYKLHTSLKQDVPYVLWNADIGPVVEILRKLLPQKKIHWSRTIGC